MYTSTHGQDKLPFATVVLKNTSVNTCSTLFTYLLEVFLLISRKKPAILSFLQGVCVGITEDRVVLIDIEGNGSILPRPQKTTALAVDEYAYNRDDALLSAAVREANRRNQVVPRACPWGSTISSIKNC